MAKPNKLNVQDAPVDRDAFFRGYTIEELAKIQGVRPLEDFESLLGGWPDDIDDGFEEAVARWRGHEPGSKG
ncbi:MAG: hypothetical protein QOH06_321 [Acidobacteriota bacterium]|jgi:hypothetical protein|nr:hypothetical protein [Acidobacteriota bacterium]